MNMKHVPKIQYDQPSPDFSRDLNRLWIKSQTAVVYFLTTNTVITSKNLKKS